MPRHTSRAFRRLHLAATAAVAAGSMLAINLHLTADDASPYDPMALAAATDRQIVNHEATVPSQCYTRTAGVANSCWTCHTEPALPNELHDASLQEEYAFSDFALTNRWTNLFVDRGAQIEAISDDEIVAYIRADNYTPLRDALKDRADYLGYRPDLDFAQGFDDEGFARDGSGWRALRYKPFLGTFWPTNGNTDDVLVRLPTTFLTIDGKPSREVYKLNLSILEAAVGAGPISRPDEKINHVVEPVDESLIGLDLDGDGSVGGTVERIVQLPPHFAGDARDVAVTRNLYPAGTEFLHTVRYVDPDAPSMLATRMKELRYAKKLEFLDPWAISRRYEEEFDEKTDGLLPLFPGSATVGIHNGYGWILQGFIEDRVGRLRAQTSEEMQYCMGCHSAVGVTVDHTFTMPRKVPGAGGWAYQSYEGIPDVPQLGHSKPEIATYFERVTGGDEFRANTEVLDRFFNADGSVKESEVARAAVGGDKDITHLIFPSPARALQLNKAYLAIVREQTFHLGRDTILGPIANVHAAIENGSTDLAATGKVFTDGRLWLDWSGYLANTQPKRTAER